MKLSDFIEKKYKDELSEPASFQNTFLSFITAVFYVSHHKFTEKIPTLSKDLSVDSIDLASMNSGGVEQLVFLSTFFKKFFNISEKDFIISLLEEAVDRVYTSTKKFLSEVNVSNLINANSKIPFLGSYYRTLCEAHKRLIDKGFEFSTDKDTLLYKNDNYVYAIKLCDFNNYYLLRYVDGKLVDTIASDINTLHDKIDALLKK